MPTFGAWEDTVLEHSFDQVEFISLHTYLNNYADDTPAFLASADLMDSFIEEVVAIADAVAARRRSPKRIMLSFDEWNVWYRTRRARARPRASRAGPWRRRSLRKSTTCEDALAFGGACISLLNHADRVTRACLAQLVNVIAPIMTETGGAGLAADDLLAVRADEQFRSRHGAARQRGLRHLCHDLSSIRWARWIRPSPLPCGALSEACRRGHRQRDHAVRAESRPGSADAAEGQIRGFGQTRVASALTMHDSDLEAVNSSANPDRIRPVKLDGVEISGDHLRATLPPASWSMITLAT